MTDQPRTGTPPDTSPAARSEMPTSAAPPAIQRPGEQRTAEHLPDEQRPVGSHRDEQHRGEQRPANHRPSIMFVCVHNAGRSQMAAGFLATLSGGAVEVRSAGSMPAAQLNPVAVAAMAEVGIDIAAQRPKILTPDAVQASDVVVTMGCGDSCPIFPGTRYEDWDLPDPAGQDLATVRGIRDQIRDRVLGLLAQLGVPAADARNSDGRNSAVRNSTVRDSDARNSDAWDVDAGSVPTA